MQRKYLLFMSAIALTVLGSSLAWVGFMRSDSGSETPLRAPVDETFIVRYDGVSFQPTEIKVRKGTKVFFVNESNQQRPMYVASDDHPTHQKYKGFDAAAVNNRFPAMSESFSFVFDTVGAWGYHDHNFPSARGIVIVE